MEQKQQMEGAKTTEGSVAKLEYLKKKSECEMEVVFRKQLVFTQNVEYKFTYKYIQIFAVYKFAHIP